MVQDSIGRKAFIDRLMNLEKIDSPEDWITKSKFKGEFIQSLSQITEKKDYILPMKKGKWWEVYETMNKITQNFKMYPILGGEYWVIEVNK